MCIMHIGAGGEHLHQVVVKCILLFKPSHMVVMNSGELTTYAVCFMLRCNDGLRHEL